MNSGDQDSRPTMFPNDPIPDSKKEPNGDVLRRPRGRPPGSKNKQKPPPPTSREPEPPAASAACVLEVCGGSDIIAAVRRFCTRRNTGLCVLSGSGAVSDVSFTNAARFRGSFSLLSISATILPQSSPISTSDFVGNKFVVSIVVGGEGKTFSGGVVGPLIASGTVYMVAVTFNNPLYHRLPPPSPMMKGDHMQQMIIRNSSAGYAPPPAAAIDDHQSPPPPPPPAAAGGSVAGGQLQRAAPPPMYGPTDMMIWPFQPLPR